MKANSYINVHPRCTSILLWDAAVSEGGGCPAAESRVSSAVSTLLNFVPRQHAHCNAELSGIHTVQTLSREKIIPSHWEVFLSKGFQDWFHEKRKMGNIKRL